MNASLCENCGGAAADYTKGAVRLCRDCFFRDNGRRKTQTLFRISREPETSVE